MFCSFHCATWGSSWSGHIGWMWKVHWCSIHEARGNEGWRCSKDCMRHHGCSVAQPIIAERHAMFFVLIVGLLKVSCCIHLLWTTSCASHCRKLTNIANFSLIRVSSTSKASKATRNSVGTTISPQSTSQIINTVRYAAKVWGFVSVNLRYDLKGEMEFLFWGCVCEARPVRDQATVRSLQFTLRPRIPHTNTFCCVLALTCSSALCVCVSFATMTGKRRGFQISAGSAHAGPFTLMLSAWVGPYQARRFPNAFA